MQDNLSFYIVYIITMYGQPLMNYFELLDIVLLKLN